MAVETLQQKYDAYKAARDAILSGQVQSYSIGDRSFTMLDLKFIEAQMQSIEGAILSGTQIYADLSGVAHAPPWPEG